MAMLEVKDLVVNYGLIKAVKGVSFEINEGEMVALIGANGAGKTTIMHALSGLIKSADGCITFEGCKINNLPTHKISTLGLVQVPEGRRVFSELSVKDNLILGAYSRTSKQEITETLEKVFEIFPILKERSSQMSGTLSGGEQQMLAVGRAMMSKPRMLLLDEPSMGLSPLYVNIIFETISKLNKSGITVFVVEQNAMKALTYSDRAYVLETGKITMSDRAEELLKNPQIKAAYLGQ